MWRTAGRRFVWHACLRKTFWPFLFGIPSIHFLPAASGTRERQYAPPALHYGCIMPIPSFQLKKNTSLMQRSRGFGHGVVVSKICYVQYSDCVEDLDCRILISRSVVTCDCCTAMNHCRDWVFSHSGLEAGPPAFQLPMFAECDTLHELCSTCLSKESMPFVNSKPPFPARSLRFLRAAVRSASFAVNYGCIMPISSLQLQKKPVLCKEGESLVTELWSPRIVTIYLLCSYVTAN